jgi:hypothetical protein
MLISLRSLKLPAPGNWGAIGGIGILPQGAYATGAATRVSGDWIPGALGQEFEVGSQTGGMFSAAAVRAEIYKSLTAAEQATLLNFGGCRIQLVKGLSSSTGAPAAGKLAFMSDRTGFVVTPDPDTNVGNAVGVYLWTPTNKGDYCLIVNLGDVETRCKATVTNASTAGKPVYAVSDSSLGVIDGLADATAVTNLILGTEVGKVIATLSNGGLVRTYIQPKLRMI